MPRTATAADRRVINWAGADAPDFERWDDYPAAAVRKIVLGPSPGGSEEQESIRFDLSELARRLPTFPNLTHLYLWKIDGLETLPALPPSLECLDVRGCANLTSLPPLPATLETLDVGGCTALQRLPLPVPTAMRRFYFDGCTALKAHALAGLLDAMREVPVEDLDGSGTPAVTSLEEFPRSARKLVLKDCTALASADDLASFAALEHLHLGGCTGLRLLPDLPPKLQYLVLHGAENLTVFMGQDIGPYDRGGEDENVARVFVSRRKFGGELAIMPHAKLLLLGDGRVGKTTLAKRLQWEELDTAERRALEPDLRPSRSERFTHKVQFWRWETGLSLPDAARAALDQRAAVAAVTLPTTPAGHLAGAVRIWDFGGQEIYHHTHRIFAGEGSIFLLVWRETRPEAGSRPPDVLPEEWEEWNRQRPLDYWLDYVYSMRPDAKVALVCAACRDPDRMTRQPNWRERAPKHAGRELPCFFIDSLDDACGAHREYQRLVAWIREACGAEAERIGILQPRLYREVSDLVDRWLAENSAARRTDRDAEHLLCPWTEWQQSVEATHQAAARPGTPVLDPDDVAAITRYLHDAGHLFLIRQQQHRAVLVDQEWAASLIYELLLAGGTLRRMVKRNGGWFYDTDLESAPLWQSLKDDLQRDRLLGFMEECRLVTRITTPEHQREGKTVFLASDTSLLPAYEMVEDEIEKRIAPLRGQPDTMAKEAFEFGNVAISEFDFRALQALLARTFGTRAVYFRNGLQAMDAGAVPAWCFRVRWLPDADEPFSGRIQALLLASGGDRLDALAREIDDLVYAEGGPIPRPRRPVRRRGELERRDVGHEYFRSLRQDEYDIGVSSSGPDGGEAAEMVQALEAAGLRVLWYRRPECRRDDRARVLSFMNSLSKQPCIILLLSEAYLKPDPVLNWYCAWELADAIRKLGDGTRTDAQTLVVFKESPAFPFGTVNERAHRLLKVMAEYFHAQYGRLEPADAEQFRYYDDFSRHFYSASTSAPAFFETRGAFGSAFPLPAGHTRDFSVLIEKIKGAIGRRSPPPSA